MEELKRTKRITIGAIIAIAVMVLGFMSYKKPPFSYQLTASAMNEELYMIYQVTPEEAIEMMYDTTLAIFVDIRGIYDFEKGHLENAINIPVANLLNSEQLVKFDRWRQDSLLVVLYGNEELDANAPWMLMYQLGYSNVRNLMGGSSYIDKLYDDMLAENETFLVEDPQADFASIIKVGSANNMNDESSAPKKQVTVRKKKKKAAEGGC